MSKESVKLRNYLDKLIDEKIDKLTKCPVCISGISDILYKLNEELKSNYNGKSIQRFLKEKSLYGIYQWKKDWYPIPLNKLKEYLLLWKNICGKSEEEYTQVYDKIFLGGTYFRAKCSPIKVKIIKSIGSDLAYLLGIIFADGALRNIWLTYQNEGRLRWEISITDKLPNNLTAITGIIHKLFGIKTNVKIVYGGRWHRILFQSMILHRLLNEVFEMPMGYKKGKLKIPKIIKESPYKIRKDFLIGFFDGDGSCSNLKSKGKAYPLITVAQSNKEILSELNEILKESGFNFNLYAKRRKGYCWYVLETKDKNQIIQFEHNIGFRDKIKRERLRLLVDDFKKRN